MSETNATSQPPEQPDANQPRRKTPLRVHVLRTVLISVVVALAVFFLLHKARIWRAPYPAWSKQLSWVIGGPEEAYNFGVVAPGKLYRTGRPDTKLFQYMHENYGIKQLVMLNGEDMQELDAPPPELGMRRHVYFWSPDSPPPREELLEVLDIFQCGEPVAVHCYAGADRTGYAVAAYRILVQGWRPERAFEEMDRFWHKYKDGDSPLKNDLRRLAQNPPPGYPRTASPSPSTAQAAEAVPPGGAAE